MDLKQLTVGPFGVNCYIFTPLKNSSKSYIVDPGDNGEKIVNFIKNNELEPVAILLTHAHLDHIKGCAVVAEAFNIKVYLHSDDHQMFHSPSNELAPYLFRDCKFPDVHDYSELSNEDFSIIHTPGHTLGSVCIYFKNENVIFTGDTLFQGSIGRTDLPGGNHRQLISSIKNSLIKLPEQTSVYPGHGPSSTIAQEKNYNPFLG
ncbi:MAG: MBL fold metallo-hydrolase [Lentisphaeria bacterium]